MKNTVPRVKWTRNDIGSQKNRGMISTLGGEICATPKRWAEARNLTTGKNLMAGYIYELTMGETGRKIVVPPHPPK